MPTAMDGGNLVRQDIFGSFHFQVMLAGRRSKTCHQIFYTSYCDLFSPKNQYGDINPQATGSSNPSGRLPVGRNRHHEFLSHGILHLPFDHAPLIWFYPPWIVASLLPQDLRPISPVIKPRVIHPVWVRICYSVTCVSPEFKLQVAYPDANCFWYTSLMIYPDFPRQFADDMSTTSPLSTLKNTCWLFPRVCAILVTTTTTTEDEDDYYVYSYHSCH